MVVRQCYERLLLPSDCPLLKDDFFEFTTLSRTHVFDPRHADVVDIHLHLNAFLPQANGLAHLKHLLISLKVDVPKDPSVLLIDSSSLRRPTFRRIRV